MGSAGPARSCQSLLAVHAAAQDAGVDERMMCCRQCACMLQSMRLQQGLSEAYMPAGAQHEASGDSRDA